MSIYEPEWEMIQERTVTATKEFDCESCTKKIIPGQTYVRAFYREVKGTGTEVTRRHAECHAKHG